MCGSPVSGHKVLGKRLNQSQGRRPGKKIGISTTVMQCTNCSLIYPNPMPIPLDIQDHYGIPPESYWKEEYFHTHPGYFAREIEKSKELLAFQPGMKALDIGAGLGKCMIALAAAGYDAYGIEPSQPFYERAISVMRIDPSKLRLGMMENAEFPAEGFDFITFGAVLEHLYDPSGAIQKALTWLKPGGVIHIEVPSSKWLINKLANFYYRIRNLDYVSNISPMHTPFHLYEFGLASFRENARLNGYELAHHEYYVCKTFLPRWMDFFLKPYMKRTSSGMQLCVWLRKTA